MRYHEKIAVFMDSPRTTIEAMQRFLASLTVQVLRFPDISPRTRNRRHQGCRTRHKRCDVRQFLCRHPSSPKFQRQLAIATNLKFVSVSFEPLYRDEIKFRPMLSIRTGRANCVPGSSRSRAKWRWSWIVLAEKWSLCSLGDWKPLSAHRFHVTPKQDCSSICKEW